MTVLLLGATGFLGRYLAERLSQTMTVLAPQPRTGPPTPFSGQVAWLESRLDAADERTIDRALDEARPDVVVNAVGAPSASDPALGQRINAVFPRQLATRAAARGARVVHVSTDGVFSGMRGNYRETDVPDPIDDYGRSKLAGELAAPHLTIRTSFFGCNPRGAGLVEWLARQRGAIDGFSDYRFSGLSAALVADLIAAAMAAPTPLEGVFHVGGEPVTKYALLTAIAAELELDVRVVPATRGSVDRTLDSSRFFTEVGRRPPTLADSLATLVCCVSTARSS